MLWQKDKSLPGSKCRYFESQWVMMLITLSGGLQDAYTYCMRGEVFANAQTGNVVLLMGKIFHGESTGCLKYLSSIVLFALGILVADLIRIRVGNGRFINSMQLIVLAEAVLLLATCLIPNNTRGDIAANAIVSFCCSMQIETFKKVKGYPYASTMCIGNIKSAMEALSAWKWNRDEEKKKLFFQYLRVILIFAIGAGIGMFVCDYLGIYTIMISGALLFATFVLLGI